MLPIPNIAAEDKLVRGVGIHSRQRNQSLLFILIRFIQKFIAGIVLRIYRFGFSI